MSFTDYTAQAGERDLLGNHYVTVLSHPMLVSKTLSSTCYIGEIEMQFLKRSQMAMKMKKKMGCENIHFNADARLQLYRLCPQCWLLE